MAVNPAEVEKAAAALLRAIGEDVDRDGLRGTPARMARLWAEFIDYAPGAVNSAFEHIRTDQLVAVCGVRVYSYCEHHLLPFWCDLAMAYIPGAKILGLSKFARVAHKHAHRLQIQERLVDSIAAELAELTGVEDVAVLGRGVHLCMVMRGIKTRGEMVTSALRGRFLHCHHTRAEFMALVEQWRGHAN